MNVCDMTHMDVTWLVTFSPPYIETENKKMSISYFDFLTDESWHICMWYDLSWMSHDTRKCDMTYYQWVVTHMNVIWLLSMSHDTHECEMPHEWVMTHINVTWCTWVWHDASAFDIFHMNIHDVFVRHTFSLGLSRTKHTHTHTHTHYDTHTHTHTYTHTHTNSYTHPPTFFVDPLRIKHLHLHTQTYEHTHIHTLSLSLTHTHTYAHPHANAHTFHLDLSRTRRIALRIVSYGLPIVQDDSTFIIATHCSTLQQTTTYCNTRISSRLVRITQNEGTGWRTVIACLIFIGHFPPKSLIVIGLFAERDLQLKTSYEILPPCMLRIMPHIWMCRVTHTHALCRMYSCVMWRKSHVTRMNESCCTYEWDMS